LPEVNCDFSANDNIVLENILAHKFDLLGTGWVSVNQNTHNIETNFDYSLIHWHKDFKSSYVWQKRRWYKFISYGFKFGVDIKVPWELARLQHLPFLALSWSYSDTKEDNFKMQIEFETTVIDFVKNNPLRYGVNWSCTMDVSIRAANLVLAYEIFLSKGACFTEDFNKLFFQSLYEHGHHIYKNLECKNGISNNHYLSNICGLLFVSSVLINEEVDEWFCFANKELISEFEKQFYRDGVNFESSTSYHRLSTEMIVYSSALILGYDDHQIARLGDYILPQWFVERLYRALRFTNLIMKSNFEVPQVGDNDSGRFFKLSYQGELMKTIDAKKKYLNLSSYESTDLLYFDENILDHRSLGIGLATLFGDSLDYEAPKENAILSKLSKGRIFKRPVIHEDVYPKISSEFEVYILTRDKLLNKEFTYTFPQNKLSILDDLKVYQFLDSGFFLFKSKRLYMLVSACPNGQNGIGGHAHNDKSSFELEVDGKTIFRDPGTFLYTPNVKLRNKFRSTFAHNSILIDRYEQNSWDDGVSGLFRLNNESECSILKVDNNELIIKVQYKDVLHYRHFLITNDSLIIRDFCNKKFKQNIKNFEFYSNGYGRLMKTEYFEK
jgi:hypothetical protein